VNRKGPRVTPALCDAAKQYTRSRQRAQASGAADVLSPAGGGGDGGGRSREGGSGGGTGTEAGIAMGGVGVVEYQSIDIIQQRPAARPSLDALLACCLLAAALLLPTTNPLNGTADVSARLYRSQTRAERADERASVSSWPGVRTSRSQHAILHPSNSARALDLSLPCPCSVRTQRSASKRGSRRVFTSTPHDGDFA
jgi:hypothetical protein